MLGKLLSGGILAATLYYILPFCLLLSCCACMAHYIIKAFKKDKFATKSGFVNVTEKFATCEKLEKEDSKMK